MRPPRKRRSMAFSPQGAQKHLGQPGVFLESRIGRRAVLIWLLALAACLTIVWRSQFTADMSTFLPKNPTPQQQLLVD